MSLCPVTSDVVFDHVDKVMHAEFWFHKVTVFLFEINKSLAQRYIDMIQISCFLSYF